MPSTYSSIRRLTHPGLALRCRILKQAGIGKWPAALHSSVTTKSLGLSTTDKKW